MSEAEQTPEQRIAELEAQVEEWQSFATKQAGIAFIWQQLVDSVMDREDKQAAACYVRFTTDGGMVATIVGTSGWSEKKLGLWLGKTIVEQAKLKGKLTHDHTLMGPSVFDAQQDEPAEPEQQ